MKRWEVRTRATVIRFYYVDADDEKSAEAASCDTTSDHEEDENEETMTITEIVDEAPVSSKLRGGK
jgi:hypothetical protein